MLRSILAGALGLAVLTTACSCSGSSESSGATSTGGASAASSGAGTFPVTVQSRYGATTLQKEPARPVALSAQLADTLVAFGVKPAAFTLGGQGGGYAAFPWLEGRLGDGVMDDKLVATTGDYGANSEAVAAHDPDAIFAPLYAMRSAGAYNKLAAVAPVVTGKDLNDDWTFTIRQVGTALGRADQVDRVIADAQAPMKQLAKNHPELAGGTYQWVRYDPKAKTFTYGNGSLLETIGLKPGNGQDNTQNANANVSIENVAKLDGTLVTVFCTTTSDCETLKKNPQFQQLPAYRTGHVVYADYPFADALNSPGPSAPAYVAQRLDRALSATPSASAS